MSHAYAMIMAGGVGERFWPKSRRSTPKQLLDLTGVGASMLALTIQRLQPLVPMERILIITNVDQKELIHNMLPELKDEQVIAEPIGRNTAACVGLGAKRIYEIDPSANIIVLPADHSILDVKTFQKTLQQGMAWAEKGQLVTIGIAPDRPETEYGYIEAVQVLETEPFVLRKVERFKEKPNRETAQLFLDKGHFFWNSGMFIWKAAVILDELAAYAPELYQGLENLEASLENYATLPSLPIDIAVMEKSKRVVMIEAGFDWNDLGLWTSVENLYSQPNNANIVASGKLYYEDAKGNFVMTDEGVVGLIGIDNCIVVRDQDAVLVCPKSRAKDVKELVNQLKACPEGNLFL